MRFLTAFSNNSYSSEHLDSRLHICCTFELSLCECSQLNPAARLKILVVHSLHWLVFFFPELKLLNFWLIFKEDNTACEIHLLEVI